jgi:hypothetical protein
MYMGLMMLAHRNIHTAELLVPEQSASEVELAIEELKSHKSLGMDPIPAELIKAGDRTILYEIHKLIISIWNTEELPEEWKESFIVPIYKKGDKTNPAVNVNSICRGNYWGSSMWIPMQQFQLLIIYSSIIKYLRKNGNTTKQCTSTL